MPKTPAAVFLVCAISAQAALKSIAVPQGGKIVYPYGADLAKTYVDLTQMWRGKQRLPPASFQIASEEPVAAPPGERCSHITGQVDAQDGKGPKELNSVFCQGPLAAHGSFMNLA
jgi:hypothetical protein